MKYLFSPPDPFHWAYLPMAKVPFSDDTIFIVLDKIKNDDFVESLINELKTVFKVRNYIDFLSRVLYNLKYFLARQGI